MTSRRSPLITIGTMRDGHLSNRKSGTPAARCPFSAQG